MSQRVTDLAKSIDKFGASMNFTVNDGSSTFKTWSGALISLIILILISAYGFRKFTILIQHDDTTFQTINEKNAIAEDTVFTSEEINFNLAFVLLKEIEFGVVPVGKEEMYG